MVFVTVRLLWHFTIVCYCELDIINNKHFSRTKLRQKLPWVTYECFVHVVGLGTTTMYHVQETASNIYNHFWLVIFLRMIYSTLLSSIQYSIIHCNSDIHRSLLVVFCICCTLKLSNTFECL